MAKNETLPQAWEEMSTGAATATMDSNTRADALEHKMMKGLERIPLRSVLFTSGDRDPTGPIQDPLPAGKHVIQGPDPRLKAMPDKPTVMDFFRLRFGSATNHLLQSANLARKGGYSEKVILACLLHDIGVVGFIRSDHGYWGAQLIEPYVDEEVSWGSAITRRCASSRTRISATNIPKCMSGCSARISSPRPTSSAITNSRGSINGTAPRGRSA